MRRPQLPPDHDPARNSDGQPEPEYDALDEIARRARQARASTDRSAGEPYPVPGGGHSDDVPPSRPPRKRRRRGRRILGWTAFTVVALLAITIGYGVFNYSALTSKITHIDAISASARPATDIDGSAQNILLVGDDHRPANASAAELAQLHSGPDDGENNTDTMMILHVPGGGKPSTLISLPRDSWVNIPGFGDGKLNAAFAWGGENAPKGESADAAGAQLLVRTVQNLTGLTIDHFVRISLLGFYDIANALGPIQVCLKQAVNDPYSGADFPAGVSTLDAAQALAFVRQRHGLPNGDLDREVRQQYFLSVEAHNMLSPGTILNPGKLHDAMTAIGSAIETDPGLNLAQLAWELRSPSTLRSTTIPVSGTPTIYVSGSAVSIVQVDTAAMPAFISGIVGQPDAYTSAQAASPADTTVTVLNGGTANGAATEATHTFSTSGFHTGTPGNASETATTTIEYAPGAESQAKAVAAYLPGAALERTTSVHSVTVILGADGLMPAKPSAKPATSGSGSGSTSSPKPSSTGPGTNYATTTCIN